MVEMVNPPKIAIAIGRHISEPLPVRNIIGSMAKIMVNEVISTGRNLERPAEMTAFFSEYPRSTNKLV